MRNGVEMEFSSKNNKEETISQCNATENLRPYVICRAGTSVVAYLLTLVTLHSHSRPCKDLSAVSQ